MTILLPTQTLYEQDYFLWLETTLKQLQKGDLDSLDWENLIEEIEALGNEQKHKVSSFLRQLLIHLLLYQYWLSERDYCGNGWKQEIRNFRDELDFRLQSKTLRNYLVGQLEPIYQKARKSVIEKTGLSSDTFPQFCPYSFEQILDSDWQPGDH